MVCWSLGYDQSMQKGHRIITTPVRRLLTIVALAVVFAVYGVAMFGAGSRATVQAYQKAAFRVENLNASRQPLQI